MDGQINRSTDSRSSRSTRAAASSAAMVDLERGVAGVGEQFPSDEAAPGPTESTPQSAAVRANLRVRRVCARSGHWAPQNDGCSRATNQDQGLPGVSGWAEIADRPPKLRDRSR